MPTVTQIVTQIRPISQYLASQDIADGVLYGGRVNPMLPIQLHIVGKSVLKRYEDEGVSDSVLPSTSLVKTANYLYKLCDKYGLYALSLVNSGGVLPDTDNGDSFAFKPPLIGIVDRGTIDDPISGLTTFQSDKLIGVGKTNNDEIEIVIGVTIMWNFGDNKSFDFDSDTGVIDLSYSGNTWISGSGLYVNRNQ